MEMFSKYIIGYNKSIVAALERLNSFNVFKRKFTFEFALCDIIQWGEMFHIFWR